MEQEVTGEEEEVEEVVAEKEEVVEVTEASTKVPRCRTQNYNQKEDIALYDAWCAISILKVLLGIVGAPFMTNGTDDPVCINQVNHAPLSSVQVAEYGPYIQELFKHRNTKFGHKSFTLYHCYKELCKNEKWIQRITETTPKRSRLSISVEEDEEIDEDANNRSERNKIAKERKKRNAVGGTYKEFVAMIETKKMLAVERKEEKMTRWNELRALENEKWKTKSAAAEGGGV
ncbi:uncharacterized protein [Aegilops tauschii subsp. strangulata]|uniref:uncharacterized protein n=1 Tax=Aegilops tauschii subsp. strangulata TaxID=200361 RepID=UPI003CC88A63